MQMSLPCVVCGRLTSHESPSPTCALCRKDAKDQLATAIRERDEARAERDRYKRAVDAAQVSIEEGLRSADIADVYCSLHDIEHLLKRAALAKEPGDEVKD